MKRIATIVENGRVVGLVHGPDACDQRIRVNGKEWRFDFDEYGGPLWLRKDGQPRECQNPNKAVWRRWEGWHKRWRAEKAKAQRKAHRLAPMKPPKLETTVEGASSCAAHGLEIRRVDAPIRPGWWWYKDEHPWQVVRVVEMDGSETLWARLTNGNLLRLDNEMEGVWAGPLTPPADSPNAKLCEPAPTIDAHYGLAPGSFAKFIAYEHDRERREEADRKRHIVRMSDGL